MEKIRFNHDVQGELDDLRDQLRRAEQEREEALAAAEDAQTTVQHLDRELTQVEAALVEARAEAARLRTLVGQQQATLLETQAVRVREARRSPPDSPDEGRSVSEGVFEELQTMLEELQVTAEDLQDANNALQAVNSTLERRVEQRTAALHRALDEREALLRSKDLLIREIDHRVRNSLQLVSSLIRLQADRHEDPMLRRELGAAGARIDAIAQVHSMLCASGGVERVQFDQYLQTICDALKASLEVDGRRRDLELEADPLELSAGIAVPLALVVNELVTNAFRHAFQDGQPGTVWVQLLREPDGVYRLTIADDGRGLPRQLDLSGRIGLGLQMVAVMAAQAGATLTIGRKAGARFTLTLPAAAATRMP